MPDTNKSPRLRTVDKVKPPYSLNQFPADFGQKLGREIVYLLATKSTPSLEGSDWEQIFASCIGAEWKPSNVGLDDVILGVCAWGAKTVKSPHPHRAETIRLISGRNSPSYSFDQQNLDADAQLLGNDVLKIWNTRVESIRAKFSHLRTVVLIKSDELIINSGLNKKTISNMYNSARREIVLEATTEHYEQLYEAINNLVEQGSDIDITLTIKLRGVSVDLNINESLIVINTLAVKRAELRGGAWSTAGKQVEKVLMVVLCKLYGVPENNYDFTGLSDAQDVAEMAQFGPYKLWSADLVQCPGCGTKVITGFSRTFVEHWQPGFNQYFDRAKQRG